MKRLLCGLLVLLVACKMGAGAEPAGYVEIHKSKPVEVNGLTFVAATEAQWPVRLGASKPVVIQLWITNSSDHDLIFRTFDTVWLKIKDDAGADVFSSYGRDGTMASPSVLIHAGDTYCLALKPTLAWPKNPTLHPDNLRIDSKDKLRGVSFTDGTGAYFFFELPKAGAYELAFEIRSSEEKAELEAKKLKGQTVWSGKTATENASFEIIEVP